MFVESYTCQEIKPDILFSSISNGYWYFNWYYYILRLLEDERYSEEVP